MKTPFYADAEKLTSIDKGVSDNLRILSLCMTCAIASFIGAHFLQITDPILGKALIAVAILAVPFELFHHAQKNITRFGDELLKNLYQKEVAKNALFGILIMMSLHLFGQVESTIEKGNDPLFLLLPYLIIYGTYRSVRAEMKKL